MLLFRSAEPRRIYMNASRLEFYRLKEHIGTKSFVWWMNSTVLTVFSKPIHDSLIFCSVSPLLFHHPLLYPPCYFFFSRIFSESSFVKPPRPWRCCTRSTTLYFHLFAVVKLWISCDVDVDNHRQYESSLPLKCSRLHRTILEWSFGDVSIWSR